MVTFLYVRSSMTKSICRTFSSVVSLYRGICTDRSTLLSSVGYSATVQRTSASNCVQLTWQAKIRGHNLFVDILCCHKFQNVCFLYLLHYGSFLLGSLFISSFPQVFSPFLSIKLRTDLIRKASSVSKIFCSMTPLIYQTFNVSYFYRI